MFWTYSLCAVFLLFGSGVGYALAAYLFHLEQAAFLGAILGLFGASLCVLLGVSLYKFGTKRFLWGFVGLILGAGISRLVHEGIDPLFDFPGGTHLVSPEGQFALQWVLLSVFSFLGVVIALKVEREPHLLRLRGTEAVSDKKILDTSVIIDGRIADLCETGFFEGTFIMPNFVLQELQHIADSSDTIRRVRGRRGLDVLRRLQTMPDVDLRIVDHDFPAIREVDAKIVALAKHLSAKVLTNDMNLNKVAGLQGVSVINMNRLSTALKPVVLPGETMRLFVSKEGKESSQGVAYLDDGTMIVIDDARRAIGKKIEVVVTSVLQTSSGRMIFARMKEAMGGEQHTLEKSA